VKGITKVSLPISPLNGRELGRLLNATDGEGWLSRRDKAMLELMAPAGLRVSEIVTLRMKDVTIRPRSGDVLVRHDKGKGYPVGTANSTGIGSLSIGAS
jgi:site-specific recombinase XerD